MAWPGAAGGVAREIADSGGRELADRGLLWRGSGVVAGCGTGRVPGGAGLGLPVFLPGGAAEVSGVKSGSAGLVASAMRSSLDAGGAAL